MKLNGDTWMLTRSGKRVELLNPTPDMIDLRDIAWGLSGIPRYTAQSSRAITVLEHSINVAWLVQEMGGTEGDQLWGLMHDAHEAYVGDIGTPLKKAIRFKAEQFGAVGDIVATLALDFDGAIQKALDLPWLTAETASLVHQADRWAMAFERTALMPAHPDWTFDLSKAPVNLIVPVVVPMMPRSLMVDAFLKNFHSLKKLIANPIIHIEKPVIAAE